ncbi:MAG TPA: hypothetical protein P5287_04615 [bacterium]|nr:hypothetical protein [bacterium]
MKRLLQVIGDAIDAARSAYYEKRWHSIIENEIKIIIGVGVAALIVGLVVLCSRL